MSRLEELMWILGGVFLARLLEYLWKFAKNRYF